VDGAAANGAIAAERAPAQGQANHVNGSAVDYSLAGMRSQEIGGDLGRVRAELEGASTLLSQALADRGDFVFGELGGVMQNLSCKIAIIGQIKAGKSSFINALIRRPNFLPTHVNPWTTAVTNIHFGRADVPGDVGARFKFFDRDEWERLANGGGRLRELTERLVPGFEPELLWHHLEAMRRRAHQRLGGALDGLLGHSHDFPMPSCEILEHYVSAGTDASPSGAGSGLQIFSDIVKQADLYFPDAEFGFPTTIIDTPGTNDPFVVRDEITRRALEGADLYVVVLTARDPLSQADLALLRILRGLHKEKIAVFVNRIDELDEIAEGSKEVATYVRQRLQAEFPGADLPVVMGSAKWALASMEPAEKVVLALTPRVMGYANGSMTSRLAQLRPAAAGGELDGRQAANILLNCSGLPALNRVISRLTLTSHAGLVLKQVNRSFAEMAHYGEGALKQEFERLHRDQRNIQNRYRNGADELSLIHAEVEESQRLTSAVHAILIDLQTRTDQLIEEHDDAITLALKRVVQQAAAYECARLHRAIFSDPSLKEWVVETQGIRHLLRENFLSLFEEAVQNFSDIEAYIVPRLKSLVAAQVPEGCHAPDLVQHTEIEPPSLAALSESMALDVSQSWWRRWWGWHNDTADRLADLDALIRQEAGHMADTLAQAGRARLRTRQAVLVQHATTIYLGLVEYIQALSEKRLARTRLLISERESVELGHAEQEYRSRCEDLERRIVAVQEAGGRLAAVERVWNHGAAPVPAVPKARPVA
jgi:signal recognition particle receptor subunit beta